MKKKFWVNNLLLKVMDIIAPSWIPPGILYIKVMLAALAIKFISIDKMLIIVIMNFIYKFHWQSSDLSWKNIVFTLIMLRGTQHLSAANSISN